MNTWLIIKKEFIQNMRNMQANSMMILFPIVLIVILGAAFSGVFEKNIDLSGMKAVYTIQSNGQLAEGFLSFTESMNKELGVVFEEIDDVDEGIKTVKDNKYAGYIVLSGDPGEIHIYKNERYNLRANLMESMIATFAQRYDAYAAIARTNPEALPGIMANQEMDFVNMESLDKKKQPGSLGYYAVTMLTLILLYASLTGFWGIKSEQNQKTGNRILTAPVGKAEMLVGKVLGGIAITLVQAAVVILFSRFVLNANWGDDIATIAVIVVSESIMSIGIGTGIAFLIRHEGAASGILNTVIPIIVFFGGGYVPLSQMGQGIEKLSVISPVKWTNEAIFRVIYDMDYSLVLIAVLINLSVAALFIMASAVLSRKEAV